MLGRPLRNLRISVTDKCNLRCAYCMPEEEYVWLPRADILSFGEVARLVDAFVLVGHEKVLAGIEAAAAAGFRNTKIDTVVLRGVNDDELVDLVEFGRRFDAEVR